MKGVRCGAANGVESNLKQSGEGWRTRGMGELEKERESGPPDQPARHNSGRSCSESKIRLESE